MNRLLLTICLWGSLASLAVAEPAVYFHGKKLTNRHFVYGEVTAATRSIGAINLGFAHGLEPDQDVPVVRRMDGQLIPVGILKLHTVQAGNSWGDYEGELPLKRNDLVLVSARQLNLWNGRSRTDQLAIRTLLGNRTRGYDTGEVSPQLLRQVGDDDQRNNRTPSALHVNADEYSTWRKVERIPVVRGAFAPGASAVAAQVTSAEDRELAPDKPTLELEDALVQFVRSNAVGQINLSETSAYDLAGQLPGVVHPDELRSRLLHMNTRIRQLLAP